MENAYKEIRMQPSIKIIMKPRAAIRRDDTGLTPPQGGIPPTIARHSNAFSAYIYMKSWD